MFDPYLLHQIHTDIVAVGGFLMQHLKAFAWQTLVQRPFALHAAPPQTRRKK